MTEYKNQITLGNVLQIAQVAGVVVALAIGWTVVDQRSQATAIMLQEVRTQVSATEARLRQLEANSARDSERFSNILVTLEKIDARLARMEGRER